MAAIFVRRAQGVHVAIAELDDHARSIVTTADDPEGASVVVEADLGAVVVDLVERIVLVLIVVAVVVTALDFEVVVVAVLDAKITVMALEIAVDFTLLKPAGFSGATTFEFTVE